MQQELQFLKNKVKNLSEENMKLKSQIEGITQGIKPGNIILQLHIMKRMRLKSLYTYLQKYTKITVKHQIRTKWL